jgi:hypothetical protein
MYVGNDFAHIFNVGFTYVHTGEWQIAVSPLKPGLHEQQKSVRFLLSDQFLLGIALSLLVG